MLPVERIRNMWPVAIVLIAVVLFFWLAFCVTAWAWLQTIFCLCQLQFVRATIWFSLGSGMLFWWLGSDIDFDTWWGGSVVLVGLGGLASLLLLIKRHSRPTIPTWPTPTGNIAPIIEVEYKRLPN